MVLQLLHKTDLCLLLNWLMGRTILANAECVVCPDELNWQLHEGSHTYGWLHIVGEHEECTASWDYTTVKCHTDAAASHGELGNTCLEERAAEVALYESLCLLQEAVGLVGVGEVGRSADHVWNLLCQYAQTSCRCATSSVVVLLYALAPVNLRSLATEPLSLLCSLLWVGVSPSLLLCITLGADALKLLSTLCVEFLHLWENLEWILWVATKVLDGVYVGIATERSAMGLAVCLVGRSVCLQSTLTHDALTDDECRLALYFLCLVESLADLVNVVTVDLKYLPTQCAILGCSVLVHHLLCLGGELDVVAVVEHNEVVKAKNRCYASGTL